jgi:hypothetical protein
MTGQPQPRTRPTEEECARDILAIFRNNGVHVGETLATEELRIAFLKNVKYQISDFEDGAKYAIQQGWVGFVAGTKAKLLAPGQNELDQLRASGRSTN